MCFKICVYPSKTTIHLIHLEFVLRIQSISLVRWGKYHWTLPKSTVKSRCLYTRELITECRMICWVSSTSIVTNMYWLTDNMAWFMKWFHNFLYFTLFLLVYFCASLKKLIYIETMEAYSPYILNKILVFYYCILYCSLQTQFNNWQSEKARRSLYRNLAWRYM